MKSQKLIYLLGLLFIAGTCFAQQNYSVTSFSVEGATTINSVGINNAGDVAGWYCQGMYCDTSTGRGFIREFDGTITMFDGIPAGINDAGDVTGYGLSAGGCCFIRDHEGKFTVFDVPHYSPTTAGYTAAINNAGDVAGYIYIGLMSDTYVGFVRDQQGNLTTFFLPRGLVPTGINARGDITGYSSPWYLAVTGFVRDRNGEITTFDIPEANTPGPHAWAASINNRGDVVGWFRVCGENTQNCRSRSFVRKRDGSIAVFDATAGASSTMAASINERGDIVGQFSDDTGTHQFLRDKKGNITVFEGATMVGINNRGDVTGGNTIGSLHSSQ